jgi:hypothetical protein
MNYLAEGLNNGFQSGFAAGTQKKRDKKQMEDQLVRDTKAIEAQENLNNKVLTKRQQGETDMLNARKTIEQEAELIRRAREESDPRNILARKQAQAQLDTFGQPKTLTPEEQLQADVARMKLEKERNALSTPSVAPAPMAKVRRNLGADGKGGYTEFEIPQTDIEKTISGSKAEGYKSPYARQIADLTGQIAKQQGAIDGGDSRTGFLGVGSSRQGIVDENQKQLMRLHAMDLQEQVRAGVISREEADAKANELLGIK